MRGRDSSRAASAVAIVLGLSACSLILRPEPADTRPYVEFSHASHVPAGAPASSCGPCHQQPSTFEQVPAGHPACVRCHTIGQQPGRDCVYCHATASPGAAPPRAERTFSFTHMAHRYVIVDMATCAPCHEMAGAEVRTTIDEDSCLQCHRRRRAPTACSACHVGMSRSTMPDSHRDAGFLRQHTDVPRARCLRCHVSSFCSDCHDRSHTPLWKRSAHGLDAVRDSRGCASCHEADECDRCHRTVPPVNHGVADWLGFGHAMPARLSTRACVTCHEVDECARCHRE